MGEYYKGHKLGTCEDLYYVRRDELDAIPINREIAPYLNSEYKWRYRFPWPDEDDQGYTACDSRDMRTHYIDNAWSVISDDIKDSLGHGKIQVTYHRPDKPTDNIFNPWTLLPCPNSPESHQVMTVWNHGLTGLEICADAIRYGQRVTIFRCPYCGRSFSLPAADVDKIRELILQEAEYYNTRGLDDTAIFLTTLAGRLYGLVNDDITETA